MLKHIAAFEAKYHLRAPLFAVAFALFFLIAFGGTTIDDVQIGPGGNTHLNSPFTIAMVMSVLNVFGIFVVTAFVASAVIRDDETGFAPMVRTTRLRKADYLLGRFGGAFLVAFLVMLSVPLAMWLGSLMPWVNPEKLGPVRLWPYVYAALVMNLPTLLLIAAAFFALATATRSMMWTYVGATAFLVLFFVSRTLLSDPRFDTLSSLSDPFGVTPIGVMTKYWTAAERNTQLVPLEGLLLQNRLLWTGVALALFALAYALFRFDAKGLAGRQRAKREARLLAQAPAEALTSAGRAVMPAAVGATRLGWPQMWALVKFDVLSVVKSPAFFVLLAIGLLNSLGSLSGIVERRGTEFFPVTRAVVEALGNSFALIPLIIAIFYAGELVWRDRQQRMHELVDATPTPAWSHLLPKVMALAAVLAAAYAVASLAGMGYQLAHGYTQLEVGNYLRWLVLPGVASAFMFAALAIAVQVIVPSKPVGWAVMLVIIVLQVALSSSGWNHVLVNFGAAPAAPLSDMNGMGRFWVGHAWGTAYWLAFCGVLLVLAYGLWRRGTQDDLRPRLAALGQRLSGAPMLWLTAFAALWLAIGAFIFYNTNVLNTFRSKSAGERLAAAEEKALLPFEGKPQPTVVKVKLKVAIHPQEVRAATQGEYLLENRSGKPLTEALLTWNSRLAIKTLTLPGAQVAKEWPEFGSRLVTLDPPMQPGEQRTLQFETVLQERGFPSSGPLTRIVGNGTFLDNFEIAPMLGYKRGGGLQDRAKRRKWGLEPELRMAKLEDDSARAHHYLRLDSDFVHADLTIETDADQTPLAPGYTVSDVTAHGRRTVHTVTEAPIHNFFSIQSARYAVGKDVYRRSDGSSVDLAVYHHPEHHHNIGRILKAMQASLGLFEQRFSPYQFKQLRILEFPAYASFAQSFANTVPFSEGIGFVQNLRSDDAFDLVTYVTAHEIAHQWWAHQVIGADQQGSTLLSESFSQYAALRVMEQMFGPAALRKFLKYELDTYLRSRGGEVVEELPINRVENQQYIHYNKGSLVMWWAKEALGADVVDRAMQRLIEAHAFKPAPYPNSRDFIALLREEAGPAHQQLITDLFEKITLYDMQAKDAKTRQLPSGQWETRFTVTARKLYADGKGVESESPLNEPFEIGAFDAEPGKAGFTAANVLHLERRAITHGATDIVLTTAKKPSRVGVDPYNKRIDRNSDDNLVDVAAAAAK